MESKVSKTRRLEIYWFTVSYKKILFWVVAILVIGALGGFALFKDFLLKKYNQFLEAETASRPVSANRRNGSFTKLVGSVKVKKFYSVQWANADSRTTLDEGDYIQTAADSFATIVFPDSTYRMKPDSLIVVQENSEDPRTRAKTVSVRVTSGSIDLSTAAAREVGQSTNLVSAASAKLEVNPESRMEVESNPETQTARFVALRGTGRVVTASNSAPIGPNQEVTTQGAGQLTTKNLLVPPELLTPNSVKPVVAREGQSTKIEFVWSPVPEAVAYRVKVSNSSIFTSNLKDETVRETRYVTSGFEEGTYYWAVSAIGANSRSSRESDANKFTLINKSLKEKETDVYLTVEIIRISNIFLINGKTDPGASVFINEEMVPLMAADGSFKHSTSPLPRKGKNLITIVAQDRSGNSKTITREVSVD